MRRSKPAVRRIATSLGLLLFLFAGLTAQNVALAVPTWSPAGAFGSQAVGTASTITFTFTNPDAADVTLTSTAVVTGDAAFAQGATNTCTSGAVVTAAGGTCAVDVTFTPGARGAFNGTLSVSDSTNGPTSTPLTGTGTSPDASLSVGSLSFGGIPVGSTSSTKTVKLTNTGNSPLSIASISASGDFDATTNCGSALGAGAYCKIFLTFSPSVVGTRKGTLTVSDDASSGGTQSAALTGSGLAPSVKFSPTSLDFDKQRKGTTGPAKAVTLTNVGKATLHITSISAGGDFSATDACPSSVAIGASCSISVTFHPTAEGTRTGTLTVKDDIGSQHVSLTGLGTFPAFSISGTALRFGKTGLGQASQAKTISITNSGTDRLYIQSVTMTGDFKQTNTCEPYVNPGIKCTFSVTFDPKQLKRRSGSLAIAHDLGTATVSLVGVGVKALAPEPTGSVQVSPTPSTIEVPGSPTTGGRGQSPILRFILAGGLLVLLLGGLLMWLSRGKERPGGSGGPLVVPGMGPGSAVDGEDAAALAHGTVAVADADGAVAVADADGAVAESHALAADSLWGPEDVAGAAGGDGDGPPASDGASLSDELFGVQTPALAGESSGGGPTTKGSATETLKAGARGADEEMGRGHQASDEEVPLLAWVEAAMAQSPPVAGLDWSENEADELGLDEGELRPRTGKRHPD